MILPARIARFAVLASAVLLGACGTLLRNPVPVAATTTATIPQMPDVRMRAGIRSVAMERDLAESFAQESPGDFPRGADGTIHYAHLALSGGGANGAFGAGFLNGWTAAGDRPKFKVVTGVSTGALMAPFAMLGPEYDGALRDFYTTTSSRDIFIMGSLFGLARRALTGDSLLDTSPLASLIAQHVDADLLRKVGEAHRKGQRLYVGTVDLDALDFVVWNMGLIALSGRPEALDLFRQVMLASASIPIAFPPVFFEVEADGRRYDEMHVDGGVGARVFYSGGLFRPGLIGRRGGDGALAAKEDIFVIHNGQIRPPAQPTRRTLIGITTRVLDASSRSAVVGALHRIHSIAQVDQATFQWVTIPQDVTVNSEEVFDPAAMRALYDIGYRAASGRQRWETRPPATAFDEID